MPVVIVHHMEGAFDRQQQAELIHDITKAFVKQGGDGIRPSMQVVINEHADGLWGVGGTVITIDEIYRRREERKAAKAKKGD